MIRVAKAIAIGLLLSLTACASVVASNSKDSVASPNATYANAAANFSKGLSTALKIISQQVAQETNARRMLAVQYYLDHPTDGSINFSRDTGNQGFARFVCVGLDRLEQEQDGIAYLKRYGAALNALTKGPDANISALWQDIRSLRSPDGPIPLKPAHKKGSPGASPDPGQVCQQQVLKLLSLPPIEAQPARKESLAAVVALYTAVDALVKSINTAAVDALKYVDTQRRQVVFRQLVLLNSHNVRTVVDNPAIDAELDSLWVHQRQAMLLRPRAEFMSMLQYNVITQQPQIFAAAQRIDTELKGYDQQRLAQPPKNILNAVKAAQDKLEALATGKASLKDANSFLAAFVAELNTLEADLKAIQKNATAVSG